MKRVDDLPTWRPSVSADGEECICGLNLPKGTVVARGIYTSTIVGCEHCVKEFKMEGV